MCTVWHIYCILVEHRTIELIVVALNKILPFRDRRNLDVVIFAFVCNRFAEPRFSDARSSWKIYINTISCRFNRFTYL